MKAQLLILTIIFAACSKGRNDNQTETMQADSSTIPETNVRTIAATDLKTGENFSTPVISNAQKFIIPVPAFKEDGEPLIYPKGDPKAGKPILDYEGKPIGKQGIVFFNYKDQSVQAAPGDGKSVIIINEVTEEQAQKLDSEIKKLKDDVSKLSLKELKQIVEYANKELNLSDMYNSTHTFIKEKMTNVLQDDNSDTVYGFKKRDDRDINQAIYIPGEFVFKGPAASPQKFKSGGVIVVQDEKMRGVQPEIFLRTYRFADGSEIKSVDEVKSQMK